MEYDLGLDHSAAFMIAKNSPKTIPECCNDMPPTGVGRDDPDLVMLFQRKKIVDPLENGTRGLCRRRASAHGFDHGTGRT